MKKNKILFNYFEEHNDYGEEYKLYKEEQEDHNNFYKANSFNWFLQHQANNYHYLKDGIEHAEYKRQSADRTWLTAIKQYADAGEKWEQFGLMLDNY